MFTAEFGEPFTLTGFVRTSWLISKRVVFLHFFFLIKKLPPDLASIVYLFPFIFNKKNCRLSFKFMHDCLCGR